MSWGEWAKEFELAWTARFRKFSNGIKNFQKLSGQKYLMALWQLGCLCVVIRWNRGKVFLTCSQLPCNGEKRHKNDNKLYLLLAHCTARGESSTTNNRNYLCHNLFLIKDLVFYIFVRTECEEMTKACKFLCISSNFDRSHIFFISKILLVYSKKQTLCSTWTDRSKKILYGQSSERPLTLDLKFVICIAGIAGLSFVFLWS